MATKYWGPTPWVGSELMTRHNQRLDPELDGSARDKNRYANSAPIFDVFQDPESYTPENELRRVETFGEWDLEEQINFPREFPANHLEAEFYRPGVQNPERVPPSYNARDIGGRMLDAQFLSDAASDLNQDCRAEDLPAGFARFSHQAVLTDIRVENRLFITRSELFTTGDWLELFSKRFWCFFVGDYQERSTPYQPPSKARGAPIGPLPLALIIHISAKYEGSEDFVAGEGANVDLQLSEEGFNALTHSLNFLMASESDPPGFVAHTWWSLEPNPQLRRMYPLHGPGWEYPAYQRMFRRLFVLRNDFEGATIRRSHVYFGRFPPGLMPLDPLNPKIDHLPRLEREIPFTRVRANSHWWLLIIDSYTAQVYRHESTPGGGSAAINTRFLRNLNKMFRDLPRNMLATLTQRRALHPHTNDPAVMAWETVQRQTNPVFRAYHIQPLRHIISVATTLQVTNYDCGFYVLRWMRNFARSLAQGLDGGERTSLTWPPYNPATERPTIHTSLEVPRQMPHRSEDDENLDSIGQQLARHPRHIQEALWHLENAGAILICYTNTERRVRNNPTESERAFRLPECVPVLAGGWVSCTCGFIVVPVPQDHKVILHSTQEAQAGGPNPWAESVLSEVDADTLTRTREGILRDFEAGSPEAEAAEDPGYVREIALQTVLLRRALPRMLVGRNFQGPRGGCKGAFVISNLLDPAIDNSQALACGYIMRNVNQSNVMGPLPVGVPYPVSVNESLWAWVSRGEPRRRPVPVPVPASSFITSHRVRTRKPLGTQGGLVVSREANRADELQDYHQIPVIAEGEGFWGQAHVSTLAIQTEALVRTTKREAQESPYPFHTAYGDDYDSFDETLRSTHGILPRKVRRTRNTERYNRKLYEYSGSEYDTDENLDPSGQARARKRLRQSTIPENTLTYMNTNPKTITGSLPVSPCVEALDWYKHTWQTRVIMDTSLPADYQRPRGHMQTKVLIKHTTGIIGHALRFRTRTLPSHVFLGGFDGLIRYLKERPHDLTEPGGEPNVVPQMGETDELEYLTPNATGPLESQEDFEAFCNSLDAAWDANQDAVGTIEVSRWPTYCMSFVDFTFTHLGVDHPIPWAQLTTLGGVECGIKSFISHQIGTEYEFRLQYSQMDNITGVYGGPETFWAIYEPPLNRIRLHVQVVGFLQGETIARDPFIYLNVYLNTHFTSLQRFIQFCVRRSRRLEYEDQNLFYDDRSRLTGYAWVALDTQDAWTTFLQGVRDGAPLYMAFRRLILRPQPSDRSAIFGRSIHLVFMLRGVALAEAEAPSPPAYIFEYDLTHTDPQNLAQFLEGHMGLNPPYSYVVCDSRFTLQPPENTRTYDPPTMLGAVEQLLGSILRRDFYNTRLVIYGWVAGDDDLKDQIIDADDARRALRDNARAEYDAQYPDEPPRDARWIYLQQLEQEP